MDIHKLLQSKAQVVELQFNSLRALENAATLVTQYRKVFGVKEVEISYHRMILTITKK